MVVALWLGILGVLKVQPIHFGILAVCFVAVGILRIASGLKLAGIVSIVAGAITFG